MRPNADEQRQQPGLTETKPILPGIGPPTAELEQRPREKPGRRLPDKLRGQYIIQHTVLFHSQARHPGEGRLVEAKILDANSIHTRQELRHMKLIANPHEPRPIHLIPILLHEHAPVKQHTKAYSRRCKMELTMP